jgi:hypothetical protein
LDEQGHFELEHLLTTLYKVFNCERLPNIIVPIPFMYGKGQAQKGLCDSALANALLVANPL